MAALDKVMANANLDPDAEARVVAWFANKYQPTRPDVLDKCV